MKTKIILLLIFVVLLSGCTEHETLFTTKSNVLEDVDLTEPREKTPLGAWIDSILTPSSIGNENKLTGGVFGSISNLFAK